MKDFSPVELRELRDKARELERFLKLEFPGRVQKRKSQLIIEDEKPRDVRLKLDKFLHAHNLTSYRVRRRNGMLEFTTVPGRSRGRSVLDQRSRAENTP